MDPYFHFLIHCILIVFCCGGRGDRTAAKYKLERSVPSGHFQRHKTYVRPTLEYASTVWDPHKGNKSQANLLESAQNKAARFVMCDWSMSSSVMGITSTLKWESLQERRARAHVVIFHKIQHSLFDIPMTLFQHTPSTITTRGTPSKFVVPFC